LTYQNPPPIASHVANVADPEIEITREMIEAGVRELMLSFDTDGSMDAPETVVSDVFRAMTLAATR
jgi:hypothetical protein